MRTFDATTSTLAILGLGAFFLYQQSLINKVRAAVQSYQNFKTASDLAFETLQEEVRELRAENKDLREKNLDLLTEVEQFTEAEMRMMNSYDQNAVLYLINTGEKERVLEALSQPEWANTVLARFAKVLVESGTDVNIDHWQCMGCSSTYDEKVEFCTSCNSHHIQGVER